MTTNADEFELEFDSRTPLRAGGKVGTTAGTGHPPVAHVRPRATVTFRTREGSDGQIHPGSTPADFAQIDTDVIHTLTGPFFVEGAEPGDLLRIEVIEIEPDGSGVTLIWPGSGFGMLPDDEFEPTLVHWQIVDGRARSQQLPGIVIRGAPFLGVMGVAPSHERLAAIAAREARLAEAGFGVIEPSERSAFPAAACPPRTGSALHRRGRSAATSTSSSCTQGAC